ncbi:hypothetical protein ACQEU3_37760 [Spirillospora sp. CA-253888]
MRLPLLVACGLRAEAIEQALAHPGGGTWYAACSIAELLAGAGRTEDAVALLQRQGGGNAVLTGYLIELGRIKEAVGLLQQPRPTEQWRGEPPFDAPPFGTPPIAKMTSTYRCSATSDFRSERTGRAMRPLPPYRSPREIVFS